MKKENLLTNKIFSNSIINKYVEIYGKQGAVNMFMEYLNLDNLVKYSTKEQRNENQHTYLAKDVESGLYKIGKSKDVFERIKNLSVGNPNIIFVVQCNRDVENELHQKFEMKRYKGEWFNLSDKDVADIRRIFTGIPF